MTELALGDTFIRLDSTHTLTIDTEWDSFRWVYIYLFSDLAINTKGFGAFVPGVGA